MFAAENGLRGDPRLQGISEAIRVVPHFPKKGFFFFFFWLFPFFLFHYAHIHTHYWGQEMIFHFCPPRFCACISKGKNMFSIHYFVNALQNFSFSAFVITRFLKIGCSVQLVRNLASFWGIDVNDRSNLSGSCNVWLF